MARPAGVARATKDNSRKQPYKREKHDEAKRVGRLKQAWVAPTWSDEGFKLTEGYWEKVA